MNDEQIDYLKDCIRLGLIVWWNSGTGWRQLKAIREGPAGEDEPSLCGYFLNALTIAEYIALYNVGTDDIMVTSPDIKKFPGE